MTKKDLIEGRVVRNKKHNVKETIIGTCKTRMEDGTWKDGVIYIGIDRNSGYMMTFVRELNSFLNDFEIL